MHLLDANSCLKLHVITDKAYGSAYTCNERQIISVQILYYAWTDAKDRNDGCYILLLKVIYADEIEASDDSAKFIREKAAEYEAENSSVEAAAKRGYVDTVIEPAGYKKICNWRLRNVNVKKRRSPI